MTNMHSPPQPCGTCVPQPWRVSHPESVSLALLSPYTPYHYQASVSTCSSGKTLAKPPTPSPHPPACPAPPGDRHPGGHPRAQCAPTDDAAPRHGVAARRTRPRVHAPEPRVRGSAAAVQPTSARRARYLKRCTGCRRFSVAWPCVLACGYVASTQGKRVEDTKAVVFGGIGRVAERQCAVGCGLAVPVTLELILLCACR